MKFTWRGETYEAIDQSQMSWVEVAELEEKTGVTTEELATDPRLAGRALVTAAVCWISIKRQNPTVKWDDYSRAPVAETEFEREVEKPPEEVGPPPTVRPADDPLDSTGGNSSTRSATSTSATSPGSSASGRGSGAGSARRKASRSSST